MSTGMQPDSHAPGLAARGRVNRILAPLTPAPTKTSNVPALRVLQSTLCLHHEVAPIQFPHEQSSRHHRY